MKDEIIRMEKNYLAELIQVYQWFLSSLRYSKDPFGNCMVDRIDDPIWKKNNKNSMYGFVPTNHIAIMIAIIKKVLDIVRSDKDIDSKISFLDIGCGPGNILLIAAILGFNRVYGLEIDPKTIRIANRLLHSLNNKHTQCRSRYEIIHTDALKYTDYGKYDVLYYYEPMYRKGMDVLMDVLKKQMASGSIIIINGTETFKEDESFVRLSIYYSSGLLIYRKL